MPQFSPKYDDSPALTDGQKKKLPDAVQKAIAKKKLRAIRDKEKVAYRPGVPYMGSKGFGKGTASGVVTASQAHQATRTGGMPGYAKGGPVKKDGYLTDKNLKPYARVHKGEKVMPKEKTAFASYMNKMAGGRGAAALALPASIGVVSADEGKAARGAAGGVVGGSIGGIAGMAAGLGVSVPVLMAMAAKNPELFARHAGSTVAGLAGTGAVGGHLYGAHKGGKHWGKSKKASAFSNYMDKVAGHAVVPHSYLKSMNDDYHMLCKSLETLMAQAEYMKGKLNEGLVLPSWAEYKIYKAYDAMNGAVAASFPGEYLKYDAEAEAIKEAAAGQAGIIKSFKYMLSKNPAKKEAYKRAVRIMRQRNTRKLDEALRNDPQMFTRDLFPTSIMM